MRKILLLIGIVISVFCCKAQTTTLEEDPAALNRAEKALTDVIVHDIFSPPVASRIYVYANITAYEILAKAHPSSISLFGKIKSLPQIAKPGKQISFSLAAVNGFLLTGKKLVFSEPLLEDSLQQIIAIYKKRLSNKIFEASLAYGKQVSDTIISWAAKDQYKETRKLRRYNFIKAEGKWLPTPPGYMAAIEPNWNKMRVLVIDSCSQFRPEKALAFSKDTGSSFYKQAFEVYETGNKLSAEQKAEANFWDCNPFALNTEGHLNYAIKKISPGGHWISITGIVSKKLHADIMQSSKAYTLVSIAMFDGFISCWDEKYHSNLIRPETYINNYIDEAWRPILQTPPFPEYSSGHSVISTIAAVILTRIYGENISFDDNTELEFGLPVRHFSSFMQACNEAAISRLYGGIHYRAAIENGQRQGTLIAKHILKKLD